MRLESKTGTIQSSDEKIYNFISNFDNFTHLIPADKVQDWQSDGDTCSFSVSPIGKIGIRIEERTPHSMVKYSSLETSSFKFKFWTQLKSGTEATTYMRLTLDVEVNKMLEMMVRRPIQEFLDKLIDQLEQRNFNAM